MISILGCSCLPLPPCHPSLSPFMISILGCSWLPLPPCLPSLSPFMISILGCSWLPLPPCLPSLSPFMISIRCRCRLVSQACLPSWSPFCTAPFMTSILGCSWLPLPPCPPSLSPFMISILGCSWLLPSLSPFMITKLLGSRCETLVSGTSKSGHVAETNRQVRWLTVALGLFKCNLWPGPWERLEAGKAFGTLIPLVWAKNQTKCLWLCNMTWPASADWHYARKASLQTCSSWSNMRPHIYFNDWICASLANCTNQQPCCKLHTKSDMRNSRRHGCKKVIWADNFEKWNIQQSPRVGAKRALSN